MLTTSLQGKSSEKSEERELFYFATENNTELSIIVLSPRMIIQATKTILKFIVAII